MIMEYQSNQLIFKTKLVKACNKRKGKMLQNCYICLALLLLVECLTCAIIQIKLNETLGEVILEGTKLYVESVPILAFVSCLLDGIVVYYEFFGGLIGAVKCSIANRLIRLTGRYFSYIFKISNHYFHSIYQ